MKRLIFAAMLIAGCGEPSSPIAAPPPKVSPPEATRQAEASPFDSEDEERAYLMSLSNPTPEQWKRRNELNRKAERRAEEFAARVAEAKAKAEAEYRAKRPGALMEEAAKHRREGKPNAAIVKLREIAEKYPESPEADGVSRLIEECKAEARAMYEAERAKQK